MIFSASILNADFLKLKEEIEKVKPFTNWIHFDVMDGHFVNNLSFGTPILEALKDDNSIVKDVHIMVSNPLQTYRYYTSLNIDYLTFHYEACKNDEEVFKVIQAIKDEGVKVGLSIKPGTDILNIKQFLPFVDLVLIMSVEPGFGGQKFMRNALSKILYLNYYKINNEASFLIECDGGINNNNIITLAQLGLDIAVVGSYLFKAKDINEAFNKLNG